MNPTGPEQPSILRAARELGASSPAVDRSVASRDELLTGLIVAAYDALSVAAEEAAAAAHLRLAGSPWPWRPTALAALTIAAAAGVGFLPAAARRHRP